MKTKSEELLGLLAKQTFLSLWAVPNPYRDSVDPRVPNKEICDLLVVFGDDIIIFSDKHIAFQTDKPIETAWPRWYRRAVEESARQLFGAKKWLEDNPHRRFRDSACTRPLTIPMPPADRARFHLVVVARGATEACSKYFGERGTLLVSNGPWTGGPPFMVCQPELTKGFVHVWDDMALEVLLAHLDTTADLVAYLGAKEQFLTSGQRILLAGEEDALALYFSNPVKDGYEFPRPNDGESFDYIAYESGLWDDFVASPEYSSWRTDVEASKVWDEFVERSIFYSPHGPMTWDETITPSDSECALRMFAATSRLERRTYAAQIVAMAQDPNLSRPGFMRRSYGRPLRDGQPYFTFLVMPEEGDQPWKGHYQEARKMFLERQMEVVRANNPDAMDIVGLAMNPVCDGHCSELYAFLDARKWTDEMQADALEFQLLTGAFLEPVEVKIRIREFEPIPAPIAKFVHVPERSSPD